MKSLVVYFSTYGSTKKFAEEIAKQTGSDIKRIEPVIEYDENTAHYEQLAQYAKKEHDQNMQKEVKNKSNNFDSYDTIFIGYPIWWSDLTQILYTFLKNYDFPNKNVYLFSTNGGSGLAGTVETITNKLSNTKVEKNAFKLHRNSMENAPQEVDN